MPAWILAFLIVSLAILRGSAYPTCTTDEVLPTATLADGVVVGTTTALESVPSVTAYKYLGIPFAQSPPQRFSPPTDPLPRGLPLEAKQFKPSCIQQFPTEQFREIFNNPSPPESEDCLYLNIFTPSTPAPQDGWPVMFWIHGGSFSLGSGRLNEYDGSELAATQHVAIVTTNYRLNGTGHEIQQVKGSNCSLSAVFGFLGSPEIPLENRNLGLLDQRKALSWVSQNIHAFGGDSSKVTIFGESAGGYSVKQLIANPPRPLPFRAAILQSQARGPATDTEKSWAVLAAELGCNSTSAVASSQIECMRMADVDRIRKILNNRSIGFAPSYDDRTDMRSVEDVISQGTAAKVPIMIGTNADEGSILTSVMPTPQLMLERIFGNNTAALTAAREAYPANATDEELKSRILTDHDYTCTTSAIADTAAQAGYSVWRYYFDASFPNTQPFPGAGAWHTSEINLVFGTYPRNNQTTAQQVRLSRFFQRSWADFAKDPYSGPGWASIGGAGEDLEVIGANRTAWGESVKKEAVDEICGVYAAAIQENGL